MRPVNLIPPDQRSSRGASRSGPLAYLVIAGLALLLAGVVATVLASNQISESEAKLTALETRKASADARAEKLEPYSKFRNVQRQRTATVFELANSRFDWPRVLRQLSLVIPRYVVLGSLRGLAGPGLEELQGGEGGGEDAGLQEEVKGPSLALEGCAANQNRVAALIAALHQIDGVTRVGLGNAQSPTEEESGGGEGGQACTRVHFSITVAFDAAPPSPDLETEGEVSTSAPEESSESSSGGESESTSSTEANGATTTTKTTTTVNPPSSE